MHFKPFWMPCLHIKFFTSAPIPELTAVENFTKRWNGMLGSLSDFKNQFKSRKVLIRLDRNPSIRNEEKKVLIGSEFMFQEGAKLSKYRFLCCCSSEFLSEIRLICCRIEFFWKIFLSDKLALTDAREQCCCWCDGSHITSLGTYRYGTPYSQYSPAAMRLFVSILANREHRDNRLMSRITSAT